ncbi:MAG: ATP-binding protein [Bacteroidales bacterium]|nr:ATP-binding protein [Bacteroidales bacterium]
MESQNVEYKLFWKDDYLKWICGFANAQGGTIYIGIDNHDNLAGLCRTLGRCICVKFPFDGAW